MGDISHDVPIVAGLAPVIPPCGAFRSHGGTPNHPVVMNDHDLVT